MNELFKKVLSHGLIGGLGYYLGLKNSKYPKTSLFSRFIPTVIFTSALAYFLVNVPKSFINYLEKRNDNYTKIEIFKIDKGHNMNEMKLKEIEEKQKKLEERIENEYKNMNEYKKVIENNATPIYEKGINNVMRFFSDLFSFSESNNNGTNTLDKKVNEESNIMNIPNIRDENEFGLEHSNNFYFWLVFDKSDQMFYLYKEGKLVRSGLMIFNKEQDKPSNGTYYIKEIKKRLGDLYPGFITLDGIVGISGAGYYNSYKDEILDSRNITKNGFRILNEDMHYLIDNLIISTPVEVRD